MKIEYMYKVPDSSIYEEKVGLPLNVIVFELEFTAETERGFGGMEVGALDVEKQEILYAATEDGVPILLRRKQKETIGDLVDYEVLDLACWEAWMDKEKLTRRHTDEDR